MIGLHCAKTVNKHKLYLCICPNLLNFAPVFKSLVSGYIKLFFFFVKHFNRLFPYCFRLINGWEFETNQNDEYETFCRE